MTAVVSAIGELHQRLWILDALERDQELAAALGLTLDAAARDRVRGAYRSQLAALIEALRDRRTDADQPEADPADDVSGRALSRE